MPILSHSTPVGIQARLKLWLVSCLISAVLFALVEAVPSPLQLIVLFQLKSVSRLFFFNFVLLLIYAVGVSVLYLPFLIGLKDAANWHFWILLGSGTLIGPTFIVGLGLIFQAAGGNPQRIWVGDDISPGMFRLLPEMVGFGFTAAIIYITALRATTYRARPE